MELYFLTQLDPQHLKWYYWSCCYWSRNLSPEPFPSTPYTPRPSETPRYPLVSKGQFEKHFSTPVLLMNEKRGPMWTRSSLTWHWLISLPMWLPMVWPLWIFFSPQNMPCSLFWAFLHTILSAWNTLLFSMAPCLPTPLPSAGLLSNLWIPAKACLLCSLCPALCLISTKCCRSLLWISEWASLLEPCPRAAQRCRNADRPFTWIWGGCEQIHFQSMLIPSQGVLTGVQQCKMNI